MLSPCCFRTFCLTSADFQSHMSPSMPCPSLHEAHHCSPSWAEGSQRTARTRWGGKTISRVNLRTQNGSENMWKRSLSGTQSNFKFRFQIFWDILRSYLHLSMEDLDAELVNAGSTRIGYLCWCCQSNLYIIICIYIYIGDPTCQHCRPAESQHAAVEDETGGDSASCRLTWWCLPLLRKSRCEFLGYGTGRHRDSNRAQYQEEHSRLGSSWAAVDDQNLTVRRYSREFESLPWGSKIFAVLILLGSLRYIANCQYQKCPRIVIVGPGSSNFSDIIDIMT